MLHDKLTLRVHGCVDEQYLHGTWSALGIAWNVLDISAGDGGK